MRMLISTEKRLAKNEEHAIVYWKQIEDMIEREVTRENSLKRNWKTTKGQFTTFLIMWF